MSDLVERLREEDLKWQTQCDGWMVRIRDAAPDKDHSETERMLRRSLSAEAASRISQQDAELDRMRREVDEARNAEWKAAISAVQYMNANWFQDCRSDIERQALEKAAQSIIDELRRVGPTEYLDVQWKNAEDAVAAEAKAAEARKAAFIEAAEIAENYSELRDIDWWLNATKKEVSADACVSIGTILRKKAEETRA